MTYSEIATDQYMLSVLAEELSVDEADNALTALSWLTSAHPGYFPTERTFVRPEHQSGEDRATGVRFVVYGPEGIDRFLRLPRASLTSVSECIDDMYYRLVALTSLAA